MKILGAARTVGKAYLAKKLGLKTEEEIPIKRKVVAQNNLPAKLPIIGTLTWWLFLDRIHAPLWLWIIAGVIGVFYWILRWIAQAFEEEEDLFKNFYKTADYRGSS